MKAIVYHKFGSPDVLQCEEIDKPAPGDRQVLIKVRAGSVNPLDCGELKGVPYIFRVIFGLPNPTVKQPSRPGVDLAGLVEATGRGVTQFKAGDEVFGTCISDPEASGIKIWLHCQGSFAEYVCAPEATLVMKPDNVTFEQAASVPVAALTALQGLRNKGQIQTGQQVLINGAAGGVGTFAVQIAKSFGAEVTGVCSTKNMDMVKCIGADHVIDYTTENFTKGGKRYDLLFDCVGNHAVSEIRGVLNPKGICVLVGELSGRSALGFLARLAAAFVFSRFTSQKFVTLLARPNKADLIILHDLMRSGEIKPMIDKRFRLSEVPQALRYLGEKHARGKVVITVCDGTET